MSLISCCAQDELSGSSHFHKLKTNQNAEWFVSKTFICNMHIALSAMMRDLAINLQNRIHPRGQGMPKNPYAKKVHLAHQHVAHVLVL